MISGARRLLCNLNTAEPKSFIMRWLHWTRPQLISDLVRLFIPSLRRRVRHPWFVLSNWQSKIGTNTHTHTHCTQKSMCAAICTLSVGFYKLNIMEENWMERTERLLLWLSAFLSKAGCPAGALWLVLQLQKLYLLGWSNRAFDTASHSISCAMMGFCVCMSAILEVWLMWRQCGWNKKRGEERNFLKKKSSQKGKYEKPQGRSVEDADDLWETSFWGF